MQSLSSYYAEPAPTLRPLPTKATQLHPELLDISQPCPYATPSSQYTVSPTFEQAFPKLTASPISPTAYSPFPDVYIQGARSPTVMSEPSRGESRYKQWSCPYPSPSPEPSPQTSSSVIASNPQGLTTTPEAGGERHIIWETMEYATFPWYLIISAISRPALQ